MIAYLDPLYTSVRPSYNRNDMKSFVVYEVYNLISKQQQQQLQQLYIKSGEIERGLYGLSARLYTRTSFQSLADRPSKMGQFLATHDDGNAVRRNRFRTTSIAKNGGPRG